MVDCISVENMRLSDDYTIENFVPSLELMWRAACGVFENADWNGPVAILAGSGNNGGDGFALACILKTHGIDCTVYTLSQRCSADSDHYAKRAISEGVSVFPFCGDVDLSAFETVVDCLLGTGFQGSLRKNYLDAIHAINASGSYVVSVDINSGMNGDTGEAEEAVRSDLTVTVGYVKNGLIMPNAGRYMKKLVCADIGIMLIRTENHICTDAEWKALCDETGSGPDTQALEFNGAMYRPCPPWLVI